MQHTYEFTDVKVRLPPACANVLVIRRVTRHGRVMYRQVMEYIGTHPAEAVRELEILAWTQLQMPGWIPQASYSNIEDLHEALRYAVGEYTKLRIEDIYRNEA